MQTDRRTIELNSSADPSKSAPHGDEGRFWGDIVEKVDGWFISTEVAKQ
jgi:hypothetical protein